MLLLAESVKMAMALNALGIKNVAGTAARLGYLSPHMRIDEEFDIRSTDILQR